MNSASRRIAVLQSHLSCSDGSCGIGEQSDCCLEHCSATAGVGGSGTGGSSSAAPALPPSVVLVGGMVMDLQAAPTGAADVQRGGSVPGRVTQSPGGVARNVAELVARLLASNGTPSSSSSGLPLLVSAVGDDLAGRALLQHWASLGLSAEGIAVVPGAATPTVAVVFDKSGDVAACVADVAMLEAALTPELLLQSQPCVPRSLAAAPLLMLDGNLTEAALEAACQLAGPASPAPAGAPGSASHLQHGGSTTRRRRVTWFEPVSVPKAVRATRLLSLLDFVSPNEAELVAMADAVRRQQQQQQQGGSSRAAQRQEHSSILPERACGSSSCAACQPSSSPGTGSASPAGAASAAEVAVRTLLPHIRTLLAAGVGAIVLTLGAAGAALCRLAPQDHRHMAVTLVPALPAAVVNTSGAGDCLVAGCLFALARGKAPEQALAYGVAAAKAAVESATNVPPGLSAALLERDAAAAGAQAAILSLPAVCACPGCAAA